MTTEQIADITLTTTVVSQMMNNVYLLERGADRVLIDAANEPERLLEVIGDEPLQTVITTHRHPDHIGALAEVAAATGARLICGRPDKDAIDAATGTTSESVWTGDTIREGSIELEVIGLVGHTPGAIALALRTEGNPVYLFSGDSLFPGGPGKTNTPGDFTSLMDDLETRIFGVFGDDTVVLPGHGDRTTLGAERPHLGEWRERGW